MDVITSVTSLKKNVSRLYNKISQEIYGLGVKKQRIEILENSLVIFSEHKRVPALKALSKSFPELSISADAALINEFKYRLQTRIEESMRVTVIAVLKDFDPETEKAVTVIHFDKPLAEMELYH